MISISLALLLGGCAVWQTSFTIYQLFLSPLAGIPGPKLAASTLLYEFYYEVICMGKYTQQIELMHRVYGPIVRISPYEIHIKDPEFCLKEFSATQKLDKYGWWYRVFGGPGATISTEHHDMHRHRLAAFQKFLSRRAVTAFLPSIKEKLRDVAIIMNKHAITRSPVNLSGLFRCLAADLVSLYAVSHPLDLIKSDDFGAEFLSTLRFFFEMATVSRYLSFLDVIFELLPAKLLQMISTQPAIQLMHLVQHLDSSVSAATSKTPSEPPHDHVCLLDRIFQSGLNQHERSPARLAQEAQQFIVAGSETTGHTLAVTIFHILQNPDVQAKLRQELNSAKVSFDEDVDLTLLQNLPYLSAIVTEGLRLSHGVGSRLPRVNKSRDIYYGSWRIPAGTPISMTSRLHHQDSRLFPKPMEFIPDRWLSDESKALKKYLSPFGHGSRICAGMHLALCELKMTVAYLTLHYNMVIFNTQEEDLVSANDLGAPFPKRDSIGLQVLVQIRE